MSYLYFGSGDTMVKQVAATQGVLNVASPSYFDLNADGSLKLTPQFSEDGIRRMQAMGVKVVPFLSNHWDRASGERALDNREALVDELVQVIETYDLDGVNVDIENMSELYRAKYTDLVRLLRERLPADKEVSVAVAANPSGWQKGWHGSYDYAALAEHADYLMLMAYDQSYQGGPEGSVASLDWVERSIQYALSQSVPADKLVLGLAFYGRYWLQGSTSIAHQGMGVSNARIAQIIETYDGRVTFDPATATPKAVFSIQSGDPRTEVAGRTLPDGTYHVYYENNESLRRKVALVEKYGLKGTGSWSLGQEEPSLWEAYARWLDDGAGTAGPVFSDIAGHWASASIHKAYAKGWINGKSATAFAPDASLTRAEAAALLVRMLELGPQAALGQPFRDVPKGHWAYEAVGTAYQHGLLKGTGAGAFSPDASVTREQIAVILDRMIADRETAALKATQVSVTAVQFSDMAAARWSQPAVARMAQQGMLAGYGDGSFRPAQPLTRAEATALLLRADARLAGDVGASAATLLRHGMESAAVSALQSDLAKLGYFDHAVTGYFGDITQAAVERFQEDHGLAVDGIVGLQTSAKLRMALAPRT